VILDEEQLVMERSSDGARRVMACAAWHGDADATELELLVGLTPPVLDVGCGPGRIVAALAATGVPVLGIDVAPSALALAVRTGAAVLHRSVFQRLPGEGRWGTALLLDGNVGIGGDPERLLRRIADTLRPGGEAVVEVEGPGSPTEVDRVRLQRAGLDVSPWFPWAWVGADDLPGMATGAGFSSARVETRDGRHFGRLQR
jgi:SAM-dependent methyltransferase